MAKKHGKKYVDALKLIDETKLYSPKEAVELVKKTVVTKFDSSVEASFRLGINPKYADQQVRGAMVLPHGTGKSKKVLVFAEGAKAEEAKACVATPNMMGKVGRLGKLLGPKGLMPNPKVGTVTMDITKALNEIKAGKVEYRADKAGNVQAMIGKSSFSEEALLDNYIALVTTLIKVKPSGAKGQYIKSVTLSTTMGPGIKIDVLKADSAK